MFRGFPFWYSDVLEFYNSANLKLPDAKAQIADELNLQRQDNQYYMINSKRCFFLETKISFNIEMQPLKAIVKYRFSLINALFIMLIFILIAIFVGINNYKTASYLLLLAAILIFFIVASGQNTFIRRKIESAIVLPNFEGDVQTLHNQLVNMNNIDCCPACGAMRSSGISVCQNCGTKLPS